MMRLQARPPLLITKQVPPERILIATQWACRKLHHAIDRPNMNERPYYQRLDDKIMGDIATIEVAAHLRELGIKCVAYDQIRINRFEENDPGWDLAIGPDANDWGRKAMNEGDRADRADPRYPPDTLVTASVKSSRVPERGYLGNMIRKYDFKIFARPNQTIEQAVTSAIEIQVYYDYHAVPRPTEEQLEDAVARCANNRADCQAVVDVFGVVHRFGRCYLTAWNTRDDIITYSHSLPEGQRTWISYHEGAEAPMWRAPLKRGRGF